MKAFRLIVLMIAIQCGTLYDLAWGHGRMEKPVGRSSRWRLGGPAPRNYNDNELFCGGRMFQKRQGGKCGLCGDRYTDPTPRANELGGKYGGSGVIVETYENKKTADINVYLSANHRGYFQFDLCNLDESNESEDCFAKYPLKFTDGSDKLDVTNKYRSITTTVILPPGLNCEHCVLRWTYTTGNHWRDAQEMFRSCADVRITSSSGKSNAFKNRRRSMKKW